jgi:hypothetical protein
MVGLGCSVTPIRKIPSALNPARNGRRFLTIYRFFCDESYDGDPNAPGSVPLGKRDGDHVPATFVVAGFVADQDTWERITGPWQAENERQGVTRYHAVDLNGLRNEFKGWIRQRQVAYSKHLLGLIRDQGMDMHAIACGMLVRDYEDVISPEGRERFGPPHIACFKTVVSMIAQEIVSLRFKFRPDDKFAVIFDRNKYDVELVEAFRGMKWHPSYPFGGKLATCNPGTSKEYVQLQAADFIAYESFKALHRIHKTGTVMARRSLKSLFSDNGFMSYYLYRDNLTELKPQLESATCEPNGFILQIGLRDDMGIGIPLP